MDFFQAQDNARKATGSLIFYFAWAMLGTALGVALLAWLGTHWWMLEYVKPGRRSPVDPMLVALWCGMGASAVILLGTLYKTVQLKKGGGGSVARMLGGVEVEPNTADPALKRYVNVVEEMALASGVQTPEIFVLPNESGINAFAAGFEPNHAAVAVTRGTLDSLTRDELQGVVGHEFSHILNGDMRLNIRLMAVIHGVMCIFLIGYYALRVGGRSRGKGAAAPALAGLGLMAVGGIGALFGNLIRAAVSRQREFLADASAVQFTRNPKGLVGAFTKIAAGLGSRIENPNAPQAGHFFFASGLTGWFSNLFATHPPIEERIRRIDPAWDGSIPLLGKEQAAEVAGREIERLEAERARMGAAGSHAQAVAGLFGRTPEAAQSLAGLVDSVGKFGDAHVERARTILDDLPETALTAAHTPNRVIGLYYALLLDEREAIFTKQRDLLAAARPTDRDEALSLFERVKSLSPSRRIALIDLALPALKKSVLTPARLDECLRLVDGLITADGRVDVYEWMLKRVIVARLRGVKETRTILDRTKPLKELATEAGVLLSCVCRYGSRGPERAKTAFRAATEELDAAGIGLVFTDDCDLAKADKALDALKSLSGADTKRLLRAVAAGIGSDREVTKVEAYIFKAAAEALNCPTPPLLPGQFPDRLEIGASA